MTSDTTSLRMLCDVCEDTLSRMLDTSEDQVDHHSSHANLVRSAADDCFICSGIIEDISQRNHRLAQHPSRPLTSWYSISYGDKNKSMQVEVHLNDYDQDCPIRDSENILHVVKIYDFTAVTTHDRLSEREEIRFPTAFSNFTDSVETTSHIVNWIKQCTDTHDICKEGREDMWMPSRLLEISDVRGDLHLRLRDRSELRRNRYCTLSHRWGDSVTQSHHLTTRSLNSLRKEITVSTLSPTFRDMADLAWRLGIRLMWIDCMCIIQDDTQDWRDESALMGKVYANSWLNVSANTRDHSRSGLYAERHVSCYLAHFRTRHDESGEATTWTVTDAEEWSNEVEGAPVNRRAWVLQERILSPRIVHMSSKQVLWECRQLQASEHLPYGGSTYTESPNSYNKIKRICYGNREKDQDDVFTDWDHLVGHYTCCGLTFETDRLIALSGIASMVHKRTQCDYLAGIWRKSLPIGLLWSKWWPTTGETVAKTMIDANGSPKYVAPSWSWASATDNVRQPTSNGKYRTYATVRRCETSLANPVDMFGAVLAGMIELRAPLGTLDWSGTHVNNKDHDMLFHYNTGMKISMPMESGTAETIAQWSSIQQKHHLFLDRKEYLDLHTAYFTVIRTQSEASQYDFESHTWHLGYNVQGLLLKRLPCSRYVRIGVASLEFDTEQDFISKMPEQDVIII